MEDGRSEEGAIAIFWGLIGESNELGLVGSVDDGAEGLDFGVMMMRSGEEHTSEYGMGRGRRNPS